MVVGGEAEVGVDFFFERLPPCTCNALLLLANFTKAYTLLLLLFIYLIFVVIGWWS